MPCCSPGVVVGMLWAIHTATFFLLSSLLSLCSVRILMALDLLTSLQSPSALCLNVRRWLTVVKTIKTVFWMRKSSAYYSRRNATHCWSLIHFLFLNIDFYAVVERIGCLKNIDWLKSQLKFAKATTKKSSRLFLATMIKVIHWFGAFKSLAFSVKHFIIISFVKLLHV